MGELERIAKVKRESQLIGEFLEWLRSKYTVCEPCRHGYRPASKSIEELLAEYFEIDLEQAERERQELFRQIREARS